MAMMARQNPFFLSTLDDAGEPAGAGRKSGAADSQWWGG